jgi:putative acetyltransferase
MITILKTNSFNLDFVELVTHLDAYLAEKDGRDHLFYNQYNKLDKIKHVMVTYYEDKPVSCGALKEYDVNTMEVKRMFTLPEYRRQGFGVFLLGQLEKWAAELGYKKCILETGKRQPEAIALYKKSGYKLIPNYGQYAGMDNSVCFEKEMK